MAQTFIHNFDKVSPLGYKQPANDPNAASPDYITHAQLRYSPFTSSEAIAGSVVSGANSTFSFSIEDAQIAYTFKMYYSTDGTTYTEDKTFGGADGKKLFGANDLSGYVTLSGAQNITGTKTVTSSANLVIASGSDITVQTGGDLTLADAPTASTDAANKAYVDGLTFKSCVFWIDALSVDNTTVPLSYRRIYNNTGVTPTLAYGFNAYGERGIAVTFNRTSSAWDLQTTQLAHDDGVFATYPGSILYTDPLINQASSATSAFLVYGVFALDALQTVTKHYYDMLTADTWGRTGNNPDKYLVTNVSGITLHYVASQLTQKNARIELRFYD